MWGFRHSAGCGGPRAAGAFRHLLLLAQRDLPLAAQSAFVEGRRHIEVVVTIIPDSLGAIAPIASCIWAAQPASNAQTALVVIFALVCWGSARSSEHAVCARCSVLRRKATSDRAVATVRLVDAALPSVAAIGGDRRMDVLCVCRRRHGAAPHK